MSRGQRLQPGAATRLVASRASRFPGGRPPTAVWLAVSLTCDHPVPLRRKMARSMRWVGPGGKQLGEPSTRVLGSRPAECEARCRHRSYIKFLQGSGSRGHQFPPTIPPRDARFHHIARRHRQHIHRQCDFHRRKWWRITRHCRLGRSRIHRARTRHKFAPDPRGQSADQ